MAKGSGSGGRGGGAGGSGASRGGTGVDRLDGLRAASASRDAIREREGFPTRGDTQLVQEELEKLRAQSTNQKERDDLLSNIVGMSVRDKMLPPPRAQRATTPEPPGNVRNINVVDGYMTAAEKRGVRAVMNQVPEENQVRYMGANRSNYLIVRDGDRYYVRREYGREVSRAIFTVTRDRSR